MLRAAIASGRPGSIGLVIVAWGALLAAWAASAGAAPKPVHVPQAVEQVSLSINHTVAMEFQTPIKKAVPVNEEIASISIISPKLVLITGKTFGFTQLVIWDEAGKRYIYDIRVDIDVRRVEEMLRDASPRSKVKVVSILDTVVLTGLVPDAPTAARLLALTRVFANKVRSELQVAGTQQVLLRTMVAEITREAVRALGFNASFFGADGFGGSNVAMLNPTSIGLPGNTAVPISPPNQFVMAGGMTVAPTTTLYFGLPRTQMEAFIRAMQQDSLIRILAQPNLVAISGQEAQFLAGGELPIPVPTDTGNIAIVFKEYGVRLKFTPVVQAGQIIRIALTTEVSEPDFTNAVQIAGLTIPGLTSRRTQTVVEIGSGQTFAIAGLLSEGVRGIVERVPGLGSLPVLGSLFRSVNFERSQSELVVLVTPELVAPLSPNQATYISGRDVTAPNDWQLYGMGLLEDDTADVPATSQPAQAPLLPKGPLYGPWGIAHQADPGATDQ